MYLFLGPPIFVPSLSAIAVQEGGTAVIRCSAISNPPSSLTWFSETGASRQLLTSGDRILISPANRLTISNVQQGDNGFYTCLATNTFGSNATTGRLILAGKHRIIMELSESATHWVSPFFIY